MENNEKARKIVQELIKEFFESKDFQLESTIEEDSLEEERISNVDAAAKVKGKENFIGSHTYGEDLGGLGKMYVAYSYGEQHPLYLWDGKKWYHNTDDYILDDGSVNSWTKKHLIDLKPGKSTGKPKAWLKKKINAFKKSNSVGDNSHSDLEPGEK